MLNEEDDEKDEKGKRSKTNKETINKYLKKKDQLQHVSRTLPLCSGASSGHGGRSREERERP